LSAQRLLFLIFGSLALSAAIRVVTSHRIFHAAMWLIISFFGIAAIYLLLESPFMAGIQLFIYIGGVAVLTVIAIMVTKGIMRVDRRMTNEPWVSAMIAASLFAVMVWMIRQIVWPAVPLYSVSDGDLALLGVSLVDPAGYLLPFEVVSLMLLVVLIGALYLGKER